MLKVIKVLNKDIEVQSVISYKEFKRRIKERYATLGEGIVTKDNGKTVITKSDIELSKGCQSCKDGDWLCLFPGLRCNASCDFCSREHLNIQEDDPEGYYNGLTHEEFSDRITEEGNNIKGVSYSGGEPLLYLDTKVIPIAALISKKRPDIYQWIYTNGKLITKEVLERIRDAGIKEIRIDLAATDFSEVVMNRTRLAKEIIGNVAVEVPGIPNVRKKLIDEKLIEILPQLGVRQLNIAELYIMREKTAEYLKNTEVYYARTNLLSPTFSRNITIDIIEYVLNNNINILVNDCSNDSKLLQNRKKKFSMNLIKKH